LGSDVPGAWWIDRALSIRIDLREPRSVAYVLIWLL
jgi:hypothetical protein